ncbi:MULTISPECIES: septum site-determining protein MinC [Thiomicrorhabdus]|uniref:Probable septum site-determining protein MinC n=1 Tax=Thiomicrorhabdus heinhorstiae TaxID=2748010 RepID=A0ABS0BTN8_9GAMM|nr:MULTISPECIES: septum site-determining protein MinC [Thiomicrorhabdus]MBF6057169.1 septum site-determining protein MinC [Thiomicrorhabdus heinhorstiae]
MAKKIIDLKGSILSFTVLKLYNDNIDETKQALADKIAKAADFFIGIPIVLEPQVELKNPTYLALLIEYLRQLQMIPIGIRSEDPAIQEQAEFAGLALFPKETSKKKMPKEIEDKPVQAAAPQPVEEGLASAMRVARAVRSGQQIYAKNRDLIIMGSVNPGSEVIADGNVFVFGKVMGKVIAGSSGAEDARIYAKQLNPELVCIAGVYLLAEDIDDVYKQSFVEISLNNDKLVFNNKILD